MNRRKREDLILDAAVKVFIRRGYQKANVSELVAQAQVARGTFYLYFKSKADVLEHMVNRFMTAVLQGVSKINAASYLPDQDLSAYFRQSSSDLILCLTQHRKVAQLILFHANTLDAKTQSKISVYMEQMVRIVKSSIDAAARAGLFRAVSDSEVVARCLIGSVKEWLTAWIAQGESFELESKIGVMIDYLLAGLLPPYADRTIASSDDSHAAARMRVPGNANMQ